MDYAALKEKLETHIEVPEADANWILVVDDILNFGELRIYRDMKELLAERVRDTSKSFTINNREIEAPTSMFVVEALAFVSSGTTTPLRRVSLEFIDAVWPAQATTGTLQYFTMLDDTKAVVAGTPATAFQAVFTGYERDDPISTTNTETYISLNYPDLLFASCMVYAAGYQKDYGAQADDPQSGLSWKAVYDGLLAAAITQEERKSGRGEGWSTHAPAPLADPPRS